MGNIGKEIICSRDAHKVLLKFPDIDVFNLEKALYRAYPKQIIDLINKYDSVDKVLSMCINGYCKYNRDIDAINWDYIVFHYKYVVSKYMDKCFPYVDMVALNDISKFNFNFIDVFIGKIRVKNLWYLRKILINECESSMLDRITYNNISDMYIDCSKGDKVDIGGIKEYVGQ